MPCVAVNSAIAIMILDKSVSFVREKMANFIVDTQRKYIGLTMCRTKETSIKDDYVITPSGITMCIFQPSAGNIVPLESDENEKSVVIIITDHYLDYGSNHMTSIESDHPVLHISFDHVFRIWTHLTLLVAGRVLTQVSRSTRATPSANDHRLIPEIYISTIAQDTIQKLLNILGNI